VEFRAWESYDLSNGVWSHVIEVFGIGMPGGTSSDTVEGAIREGLFVWAR
jgi:hypothetical protein